MNRKTAKFYIEAVPQKKSNSDENFFGARTFFEEKNRQKKFTLKNSKISKIWNIKILMFQIFWFLKFSRWKKLTKKIFFKKNRAPKKISSELEKKLGYSFDVKFCGLSIYDVFRVIRALLRGFKSSLLFYNSTNPVLERCVALVSSWGRPWFWT